MTNIIQTDSQPIDIDRSHYKNIPSKNKFCCWGFLLTGYKSHTFIFMIPLFLGLVGLFVIGQICPMLYFYRVYNKGTPYFHNNFLTSKIFVLRRRVEFPTTK